MNRNCRRHRSEAAYVNAYIRTNFDPLHVLTDKAILRRYCLCKEQTRDLVEMLTRHLQRPTICAAAGWTVLVHIGLLLRGAEGWSGHESDIYFISWSVTDVIELLLRLLPIWPFHRRQRRMQGPINVPRSRWSPSSDQIRRWLLHPPPTRGPLYIFHCCCTNYPTGAPQDLMTISLI